jgi:hypothetical protein
MKALSALLVTSAIGLVVIPAAKADDYDKMTKITVNEPVRLPTMTLQPGNYSLRLLEATETGTSYKCGMKMAKA